jgi:hypothetical protein
MRNKDAAQRRHTMTTVPKSRPRRAIYYFGLDARVGEVER